MATKVVTECVSKKELKNWSAENPKQYEIELQVPYDQNSIYFQLSGGTGFMLRTINQAAADEFEIGGRYEVLISKVSE